MRLAAVFLLISSSLSAANRDFDRVVSTIESHYGVKRTKIPMMGVVNLVAKFSRPAGASEVHIATFENLPHGYGEGNDFDRLFHSLSTRDLQPMVQVHSRGNGASTYIAGGEAGKSARLLIVTLGRNEATVVEAKVSLELLQKIIENPEHAGKGFGW